MALYLSMSNHFRSMDYVVTQQWEGRKSTNFVKNPPYELTDSFENFLVELYI